MRLFTLSLTLFLSMGPVTALAEACFDRASESHHLKVDSHLHFQPFSGPSLNHETLVGYLDRAGVTHANVYGIGQTRVEHWQCLRHGKCSEFDGGIQPTMKNDFVNAKNMAAHPDSEVKLVLSMTFPDLQNPETIPRRMAILDSEFPGFFQWMGEANVVKQALFRYGHEAATFEDIANWAPFMETLRERKMPLALHSDFGNDDDPLKYLYLMQKVLESYPDNTIVWMHLGMSREQSNIDPELHVNTMSTLLDQYPNLWFDISWSVLYDYYFSNQERRPYYVDFLNQYSGRILTGTDVVASEYTDFASYERELKKNSYINQFLSDKAFRDIALGQSYFELLGLDERAAKVCD